MKLIVITLLLLFSAVALTYLNMWQTTNIDTRGNIVNRQLLWFMLWYGLIIFFFVNPVVLLTFRIYFDSYGKLMIPQLLYQAASVISPLLISWFIFREIPSNGIIAGTFFGVISVLCVVFWK